MLLAFSVADSILSTDSKVKANGFSLNTCLLYFAANNTISSC